MNKPSGIVVLCISVLVALTSCDDINDVVYSQYESIGSTGWPTTDIMGFSPAPMDSTLPADMNYTLVLNIRYNPSCRAEVLPLLFSEENAEGEMDSRTVEIRIRDSKGNLRGKKGLLLYELSDTLRTDFRIPDGYWVELMSMCPAEYSKGITDVGLSLIK